VPFFRLELGAAKEGRTLVPGPARHHLKEVCTIPACPGALVASRPAQTPPRPLREGKSIASGVRLARMWT
jgi:hypothetical protein